MKQKKIWCCIILGIFFVLGIMYFIKIRPLVKEYKELTYEKLANIDEDTFARLENTKIYDKDNHLIGEINSGNYQYSKISEISKYVQDGYIAVEDHNFKSHNGIDYLATCRAGIQYLIHYGKATQGGSTITQQLVKNSFLTQNKTISRKIAEFFLAPEIEKMYTKTQIMEYYCNSCYYGNRCYGIGNASSYYFQKDSSRLSLSEAALLVGLSNNPSKYDPVTNYEQSIEKRDRVLKHMLEKKVITKTQYQQAVNEKIEIKQYRKNVKPENYQSSFAVYQATLELMKNSGFEFQYTFDNKEDEDTYKEKYNKEYQKYYQKIRNGGYKLYTRFDENCQNALQKSIDKNLSDFKGKKKGKYELQGAGVSIDNKTGQIVAAVGGRGTNDMFNRSYLAIRQPGSSIKPLLDYAPAFESGVYYPSKVVTDVKKKNGPSNADHNYAGSCTIREAVIHSKNAVAWNILQNIGIQNGLSYLTKLQFGNLSYLDNKNASAALGGFTNGVRVVDMAKGFATLENGGVYQDNSCIRKIKFKDTVTIKHKKVKKTVYSDAAAYMVTDCMKDAVMEGTGKNAAVNGQVIAGKTGTTNDNKDSWFSGYSTYYTTSIWVGCDQPKQIENLSGSSYPAKIFHDYMAQVHKGKVKQDFVKPDSIKVLNGELFSKDINESFKKTVLEKIEEEQIKKATKAVEKFEAFVITDVESAYQLDKKYNDVISKVENIDDAQAKAKLRKRVETHYDDLEKEKEKWEEALQTYEKQKEEKRIIQNEQAKAEAEERRKNYEKEQNIALVETYIKRLNTLNEYNDSAENIISKAEKSIEKCRSYHEYSNLKTKLNQAIERVRNLESSREDLDE